MLELLQLPFPEEVIHESQLLESLAGPAGDHEKRHTSLWEQ
jgi:hypothetical protein